MIALLHGISAFGAVERYIYAVAEGLRRADEEVTLVYPAAPELAPFDRLAGGNLRIERLDAELVGGSTPRLALALAGRVARLRPRVVHVMEVWPAALVAARLAGVRRLLVTHHTPELPRRDNLFGRLWWRLGWLARPTVVYTSELDRLTDARGLPSRVVPLGIDLERFEHARPALPRNGVVIGNVGRLAEQKGQRHLIEAAPHVLERRPDARFVIVGAGELREDLEKRARGLGVHDRFTFTGARDDVPELLASFDVFAFPSLFEGLCLAVIEAQAAGVPVVATPVGGIRETVIDGQTGVLCQPGDPLGLARGILQLLEDPDEAQRLAAEARRRVSERFSAERMVEETIALYA